MNEIRKAQAEAWDECLYRVERSLEQVIPIEYLYAANPYKMREYEDEDTFRRQIEARIESEIEDQLIDHRLFSGT